MDFTNSGGGLQLLDVDGDGIADMAVSVSDTDGDGIADVGLGLMDTDGDGVIDTLAIVEDTDGNGMVDRLDILEGLGEDGSIGSVTSFDLVDTDGDGVKDAAVIAVDRNADGETDDITVLNMTEEEFNGGWFDETAVQPFEYGGSEETDGYTEGFGYEKFDPKETDMSRVVGDPAEDASQWEYQGDSGPCAIYAQAMAYQNATGTEVDIEELVAAGTEEGWYHGSTSLDDMDKALNYLGMEADVEYNGDFGDIHDALSEGGRVVVAVDADEIWFCDNDTDFTPNEPNHAVEVIGIDYSGEEPMVIINDSGVMDGSAVMIPKDRFMDAWEDSGCAYVNVCA
ncbi:MAG: hypothetical protein NC394_04355 [Bacteroides sp.]|nr:hypothetical protein [Bacteroides sp.]